MSDRIVELVEIATERIAGDPDDFLVSRLVEAGARGMNVTDAAEWLKLSRRELHRRVTRAGQPSPHNILALGRLLLCVARRNNGSRTWREAARGLYPDHPTCNQAMQRYLGLRPCDMPTVSESVDAWLETRGSP